MTTPEERTAALSSRIAEAQAATSALMSAAQQSIAASAAMPDAPQSFAGIEALLSGIESALTDVVDAMESKASIAEALALIAKKLSSLTPAAPQKVAPPIVNNIVQPTPINFTPPPAAAPVLHLMPAEEKGATWKVEFPSVHGMRTMTITRTK